MVTVPNHPPEQSQQELERPLTPEELAERWGKSEKTLANERTAGVGPDYIRVSPRRVVYPRDAVIAWEESHRVRLDQAVG